MFPPPLSCLATPILPILNDRPVVSPWEGRFEIKCFCFFPTVDTGGTGDSCPWWLVVELLERGQLSLSWLGAPKLDSWL